MAYTNQVAVTTQVKGVYFSIGVGCSAFLLIIVLFSSWAMAAIEFDIVNPDNGTKLGSITFPSEAGSTAEGVEFDYSGFSETDITSIIWELSPDFMLNLMAFRGDDPCSNPAQHGPCSNHRLTLSPTLAEEGTFSCPPPPPPGQITLCSGLASLTFIEFQPTAPAHACVGFEPPLHQGPVKVKKNRVLPFKADLLDAAGLVLTDTLLSPPPVIQVVYESGIGGTPVDVTSEALVAGQGMDGNQFEYSGSKWQFNLKVKNYTAAGTYTVTMSSGNEALYRVEPTCTAQFVIK